MEIVIVERENAQYCKTLKSDLIIKDEQMAGELIMNCRFIGSKYIVISDVQLPNGFYQLKTGIAGSILQKFSTYDAYLFIIGDHTKYSSVSLNQFIIESNKAGRINFVFTEEEVIQRLVAKM